MLFYLLYNEINKVKNIYKSNCNKYRNWLATANEQKKKKISSRSRRMNEENKSMIYGLLNTRKIKRRDNKNKNQLIQMKKKKYSELFK